MTVTSLNNSNIFIENIRPAYTYTEETKITIGMEINDLFTQYEELQKHFTTIDNLCRNKCEYNTEIKNLKSRLQRLHDLVIHL